MSKNGQILKAIDACEWVEKSSNYNKHVKDICKNTRKSLEKSLISDVK